MRKTKQCQARPAPEAGGNRWLVVSDCWFRGLPTPWGTILNLNAEEAAILIRAGRVVECSAEVYETFGQHVRGLLTKREIQVIELAHLRDKEISRQLNMSVATVRSHLAKIFVKLGRPGRGSALLFWSAWATTRY